MRDRRLIVGEVIGHMPDKVQIAPSKSYPWYGYRAEGVRLTDWQVAACAKRNMDPVTVELVEVRREATQAEMWWPTSRPAPVFAFECPVILRRPDGGVWVIAPSGERKLVRPAPPHIDSDALWAVKPRGARRYG